MTPISRRGFVGIGAGLVAGAALPAVTPTTAAAAAATGTITDVKHVVILMQENRSFDHYFGRLRVSAASPTVQPATSRAAGAPSTSPTGAGASTPGS